MTFRLLTVLASLLLVAAACSPSGGSGESDAAVPGPSDPVQPSDFPGPEEWARSYGECLRNKGWNVTIEGDGVGVDAETPEQRAVAAADGKDCDAEMIEAGVVPDPRRPPSEAYVRDLYEAALEYRDCLVSNGYPAPDAPSWESFLDARLNASEGNRSWDPLSLVAEAGDVEVLREAHVLCEGDDNG